MTKRIRFDGPGHLLTISDTLILGLGSEKDVDDDLAKLLTDSPDIYGVVTVIDGAAAWPNNHTALDALAEKFSVTWPEPAEGKQRLSVGEKVAALEAAGHTAAEAADTDTKGA